MINKQKKANRINSSRGKCYERYKEAIGLEPEGAALGRAVRDASLEGGGNLRTEG